MIFVLDKKNIPTHVALIMDGNRRFAKRLLQQPWKGHEWGAKKVNELLKWTKQYGIKYMTLYALSLENLFKRPKGELNFLFNLFESEFKKILKKSHEAHKNKLRVKVIGRIYLLPRRLQKAIKAAEESTKKYKNYFLNIAIAYGGQQEITDAVVAIAKKVSKGIIKPEKINEELIRHSLYTDSTPNPDLIIRTGGEHRISNFLLWQSAYTELYFCEKMWPEFSKQDFEAAIADFQERQRRFGK